MDDIEQLAIKTYFQGHYNPENVLLEMAMKHPQGFIDSVSENGSTSAVNGTVGNPSEFQLAHIIYEACGKEKIPAIKQLRTLGDQYGYRIGLGEAKTLIEGVQNALLQDQQNIVGLPSVQPSNTVGYLAGHAQILIDEEDVPF